MDCLFHDDEQQALHCYISELQARNIEPMVYAASDFDFHIAEIINMSTKSCIQPINLKDGYIGKYKGVPVYTFDGIDSHTCIVVPDFNTLPF